jgi:hypothetical protein
MIVDGIVFLARNSVTHEWVHVFLMFSDLLVIYIYTMVVEEEDLIPKVPDVGSTVENGWLDE